MAKAGRPTKMTPEVVDTILEAIRDLKGRVQATKEAGIDYQTFLNWMRDKSDFSNAIKKAEAEAIEKGKGVAIMTIFKAMMNGTWTAAAWWLERNFDEYTLKTKNQLSGPNGGPIQTETSDIDLSKLSTEELRVWLELAKKASKDRT